MVGDRLRQVLLAAEGAGELEGEGVLRGQAEHAVCGDRVELSARFEGDTLAELRWLASGCPASMAVAALAARALVGCDAGSLAERLRAAIDEHGGLARHERHAEALVLRALTAASPA